MNSLVAEMMQYFGIAERLKNQEDSLMHYGTKYHSGRYPYGSGEEPYQHGMDFLGRYEQLTRLGLSDVEIAKEMNLLNKKGEPSTGILRLEKKWANDMRKIHQMQTARAMADDGLGATEIGRRMGLAESSVRSLLNPVSVQRAELAMNTANFLRDQVDEKKMIDITSGVETELSMKDLSAYNICRELNISKERLKEAVYILEKEGYVTYEGGIPQPTNPGQQTTQKVLCAPGTKHNEIYNYENVHTITDYTSDDGGSTFRQMRYPSSLDSKRLKVLLKEEVGPDGETGVDKDGIIQIRRGVPDLSLGDAKYSQVRILVDGDKYLKGMAVYSDNMPDGVDVLFNSNKTSYEKALKPIKVNKNGEVEGNNPFGSLIDPKGQSEYTDPKTGEKKLSLINKRADEGDWTDWSDALPSQFLSKQSKFMAEKQLNLAKANKQAEYEDIMALTNPTIRKYYLDKFAEGCDKAAVDLKAAALPGQKYHVIIPINTLKDNEIYAPQYENGTKLALVRYPHAGTFEIPILTVNNKNGTGKTVIGTDAIDAVGINKVNAERLSGADFDGDTVMCIPTHDRAGRVKVTSTKPLKDLVGFDPQFEYPEREGMKYMKDPITGKDATQTEMGKISNLISDMTLLGAPEEDMARAVKHSMVVIDAGKHKLDYKRSEVENNIASLKKQYQIHVKEDGTIKYGGAATIISKAKGETTVDKRQGTPLVNQKGKDWYDPDKPEGSLIYKKADDLYYPVRKYDKDTGLTTVTTADGKKITYNRKNDKEREKYDPVQNIDPLTGQVSFTNKAGDISYKFKGKTQASTCMADTDDAYTLVSPAKHGMELLYADYANSMKAMANRARIESITTKETQYSADSKKKYQNEVNSLMVKLNNAEINSIKEREALRRANVNIKAYEINNPDASKSDKKKQRQMAVSAARNEVNSIARRDRNIEITDKEWEAIQAGAISKTQLNKILNNTDADKLRERAMPRATTTLNEAKINKIMRMRDSNYTLDEIAKAVGVSTSTVNSYLKGGKK